MTKKYLMSVAVAAVMLPACVAQEDAPQPEAPLPIVDGQEAEGAPVVQAEPTFILSLEGGERLLFFADPDGSVGVLGETPSGSALGSALDHPELSEASPAMIYYAVTDGGEIPAALLSHHQGLATAGEIPPFDHAIDGWDRGWFLATAGKSAWSSPCLNATFNTNHCSHPDYDDDVCYFNSSDSLTWYVPSVSRYKAGYCLQTGSNRSWLYYREGAGDCLYWAALNFVWGIDSYLFGDEYSAETYRSWTWWKGAGSPVRFWKHFGGGGSGDVFDWGQRYSQASCN